MKKICWFVYLAACCSLFTAAKSAFGLDTAFTLQGQLVNAGAPANGNYDLQCALFTSPVQGSQYGPIVTVSNVAVNTGLFTTTLDFGTGVFNGTNYWLDIALRPSGVGAFVELSPRQQLTPTPYAVFAVGASVVVGAVASSALSGTYTATVTFNNPANSFSGDGSGLTGLNASQLTSGTVPPAQLPSGLVTNNATGVTLSGAFSGDGSGFTNLSADQLTGILPNNLFPNFQGPDYDAVSGGQGNNILSGPFSYIGGGQSNQTASGWSVLGGGEGNEIGSFSSGSTISGGFDNTNSGNYATVPGGYANSATGAYSFAAGFHAQAANTGSFVWSDNSTASPFVSSNDNSFNVRASGGVALATGGAGTTLDGQKVLTNNQSGVTFSGAFAGDGSGLTNLSGTQIAPNTITAAQIANGTITSGQIAQGVIQTVNLGTGIVAQANLAPRPVGTNVPLGGIAASPLLVANYTNLNGNAGTSVAVPLSTVTVVTSGRPVMVMLNGASATGPSFIYANSSSYTIGAEVFFFRNGVQVADQQYAVYALTLAEGHIPPSVFQFVDIAPAGTNTYSIQIGSFPAPGGTVSINNVQLIAFEY